MSDESASITPVLPSITINDINDTIEKKKNSLELESPSYEKNNLETLETPPKHEEKKSYFETNLDTSFYQQLNIKIDEPIAAMSISPLKRDIVLASRNGLLIIDLENPFDPPRALPYFSRWEVAEAQWNPHHTRETWIATTFNQKCLIWNLLRPKLNSVEFIVSGHDRAISDVNWNNIHPEILGTASLDTSVKIWDLRQDVNKAAQTLINWDLSISQIDFHPHKDYLLATAQETILKIWDTRKGSTPLHSIQVHDKKIANINWSRATENELLTCSYDKTIKFWDIENLSEPKGQINTTFPIGKARYTPFGRGIISIPLRCENDLYLWDKEKPEAPVFQYKGHTGIVREFLWRIRGNNETFNLEDDREFQLVTFSLDRQLRLWPIGESQLRAVGSLPRKLTPDSKSSTEKGISYRTPRHSTTSPQTNCININTAWSSNKSSKDNLSFINSSPPNSNNIISTSPLHRNTMLPLPTNLQPQKEIRTEIMTSNFVNSWIKAVKGYSKNPSDNLASYYKGWTIKSLMEEFAIMKQQFKNQGVEFERIDVPGRSCTLGLPVLLQKGGNLINIRLNIDFPIDYPNQNYPIFELSKQGIVSMADRGFILNSLQNISKAHVSKNLHCLFPCISFMLGEKPPYDLSNNNNNNGNNNNKSYSDNSDEENQTYHKANKLSNTRELVSALELEDQNIPFPRMCSGIFGNNDQLILFFSTESMLHNNNNNNSNNNNNNLFSSYHIHPRSYESLKMFRLASSNNYQYLTRNKMEDILSTSDDPDDPDELFIVSSLYYRPNAHNNTSLQLQKNQKNQKNLFTNVSDNLGGSKVSMKKNHSKQIHIRNITNFIYPDFELAYNYKIFGKSLSHILNHNRKIAKMKGRKDLSKLWKLLNLIFLFKPPKLKNRNETINLNYDEKRLSDCTKYILTEYNQNLMIWGSHPFGKKLVLNLFNYYELINDIQTLGILATIFDSLSSIEAPNEINAISKLNHDPISYSLTSEIPKDYFSPITLSRPASRLFHKNSINDRKSPILLQNPLLQTNSTIKNNSFYQKEIASPRRLPPKPVNTDINKPISPALKTTPILPTNLGLYSMSPTSTHPIKFLRENDNESHSRTSSHLFGSSLDMNYKSSLYGSLGRHSMELHAYDPNGGLKMEDTGKFNKDTFEGPGSFSTTHSRETMLSFNTLSKQSGNNSLLMNQEEKEMKENKQLNSLFSIEEQLKFNFYRALYAEILYKWGLLDQRAELLKNSEILKQDKNHIGLEIHPTCYHCLSPLEFENGLNSPSLGNNNNNGNKENVIKRYCKKCYQHRMYPKCTICQTFVKGISSFCNICGHGGHMNHMKEWFDTNFEGENAACPAGCGCNCIEVQAELML
ncbi:hypothetical protein K502DRAFT_303240 [Neoconidiobolus thromboides FSU 785]|nr:hypothetical protein K502DRAFT_303240 [Neoconidiobolus thromboides FSU 785]